MEIILKEDLKGVGYKNDIVSVKPGFGRNFLIPQGKAKEIGEYEVVLDLHKTVKHTMKFNVVAE